jgi:hypothetical protein
MFRNDGKSLLRSLVDHEEGGVDLANHEQFRKG